MTKPLFHQLQTIGIAGVSTPLLPGGRNRLIHGDCLPVMRALPAEGVDVIYLDPPFFSEQDYHLHDGAGSGAFTDRWDGGLHGYLTWLRERLVEMRRLLQPEGAIFVHLDWHAVHYVKVIMDHLFGYRNFQNEFIWYYSGGGASKQRFARKHDTILYYTKSAARWKFYADRVRTPHKWTNGQRRADGSARDYARGKLADDVWQHHALLPWAEESTGYPTQKPATLLERLLLATSDPGDVVGDFFCGSGTTAVAAQRLARRWVAADASRVSVCLTAERLAELLLPGCTALTAGRSREKARKRFARIMEDEGRIGLTPDALECCSAARIEHPGLSVEVLDSSADGR